MKKALSLGILFVLVVILPRAMTQKAEDFINPILGGEIDNVKKLIQSGANVNERFSFGATGPIPPLFLAVMLGRAEICGLLIDAGADIHVVIQGMTLLHNVALSTGDEKETAELLRTAELLIAKGLDVNARATGGEIKDATPLHAAAGKGNVSVARLLIQKGADVKARGFYDSVTALHLAARNGHQNVAELLVAKGADVNAKSTFGETPLDWALSKDHQDIAELLRKHGGLAGK